MSGIVPSHDVVVVRGSDAEIVGAAPVTGRLYADSSAAGGSLSSQRITLLHRAAGATPHHHTGSSETFYVISGAAELLTGERVLTPARVIWSSSPRAPYMPSRPPLPPTPTC
jgi:uncharacterized RmlC-like cupin family protein